MAIVQLLYQLQVAELGIEENRRRLAEVEARLEDDSELRDRRRLLEEKEAALRRWRGKQRDLELELRGLEGKIKSLEERLYGGRVRNPKELASLQEEEGYLHKKRGEVEDALLEAMLAVEEGEREVASLREEVRRLEVKWEEEQVSLKAERERLMSLLASLEKERASLRESLDARALSLYEELREKKGGRAVAALEGDTCQVCGVALPTSRAQRIRQEGILDFCPSCGRILCPR